MPFIYAYYHKGLKLSFRNGLAFILWVMLEYGWGDNVLFLCISMFYAGSYVVFTALLQFEFKNVNDINKVNNKYSSCSKCTHCRGCMNWLAARSCLSSTLLQRLASLFQSTFLHTLTLDKLRRAAFLSSWYRLWARGTVPVRTPFFSLGSLQLTLSEVSRISVKLRCPTAPGTERGQRRASKVKWNAVEGVRIHAWTHSQAGEKAFAF